MANYSIPNSTPAIGRISTPLSRRSKKQNNLFAITNPESDGCLVVLAVFKTVVGSAYRDRGRFDSYPLRQTFSLPLALAPALKFQIAKGGDQTCRVSKFEHSLRSHPAPGELQN